MNQKVYNNTSELLEFLIGGNKAGVLLGAKSTKNAGAFNPPAPPN